MGLPWLVVQWLRLRNSTAGGVGLIPGRGTKIHVPRGVTKRKINLNGVVEEITDAQAC